MALGMCYSLPTSTYLHGRMGNTVAVLGKPYLENTNAID